MKKKNKFIRLLICLHLFLPLALKTTPLFTFMHYITSYSKHFSDLHEVTTLYKQNSYQTGKLFFVSTTAALLTSAFLNRKKSLIEVIKNTPNTKLFLFASTYFLETYFSFKKYKMSQEFYEYRNANGKSLLLFSFSFPSSESDQKEKIVLSSINKPELNKIEFSSKIESNFKEQHSFERESLRKITSNSTKFLNLKSSFEEVSAKETADPSLCKIESIQPQQRGNEYDKIISSSSLPERAIESTSFFRNLTPSMEQNSQLIIKNAEETLSKDRKSESVTEEIFYNSDHSNILKEKPTEELRELVEESIEKIFEEKNENIGGENPFREFNDEAFKVMQKAFHAASEKMKNKPIILLVKNIKRLFSVEKALRKSPQAHL